MLDFKPISLGERSNPARRGRNYASRLINCASEENGNEGRTSLSIYPESGFRNFGSLIQAGAGIRGMFTLSDSAALVAAGRNLYRISAAGASTLLGGIPTDGPVYMERNRREPAQVGIVSDGLYYVYTDGGGLMQINDPDLPPPNSFAFLEGYGILPTGKRFSLTGLDDFTTIDALDFASNESYPDDTIRVATLNGEAVFFGTGSIEFWQNTGGEGFPLSKRFALEIGCLAAGSVAKVDTEQNKALAFVASDHTVRLLSGAEPVVISTPEIAELIKDLAEAGRLSELSATAWAAAGKFRYALSCGSWTRVFDAARGRWIDRTSFGLDRWRVAHVIRFGSKTIAGDYATGQLYELRDDVYTEGDDPLIVQIVTPPVHAGPYRMRFDALALDILTAVGVNTGVSQDDDPSVFLEWSRDSGASYHGSEMLALGRLGETVKRLTARRLGLADRQGLVFRITLAAAHFKRVDGAYVSATQLAA